MPPSPAPRECIMYLIRHGATANNVADPPLLQGLGSDPELSHEGCDQAARTAKFLSQQPIRAVYCSPMSRAKQTARAIAAPHGLTPELVESIIEIDVGAWEMRSWQEISQSEPEEYSRFIENPAIYGYREGENLNQVHARVKPAMERIMQSHLGEVIVVVAHNVVNRVLLADLLGLPIALARGISQDNCGINVVRHVEGAMKLKSTNSIFHL